MGAEVVLGGEDQGDQREFHRDDRQAVLLESAGQAVVELLQQIGAGPCERLAALVRDQVMIGLEHPERGELGVIQQFPLHLVHGDGYEWLPGDDRDLGPADLAVGEDGRQSILAHPVLAGDDRPPPGVADQEAPRLRRLGDGRRGRLRFGRHLRRRGWGWRKIERPGREPDFAAREEAGSGRVGECRGSPGGEEDCGPGGSERSGILPPSPGSSSVTLAAVAGKSADLGALVALRTTGSRRSWAVETGVSWSGHASRTARLAREPIVASMASAAVALRLAGVPGWRIHQADRGSAPARSRGARSTAGASGDSHRGQARVRAVSGWRVRRRTPQPRQTRSTGSIAIAPQGPSARARPRARLRPLQPNRWDGRMKASKQFEFARPRRQASRFLITFPPTSVRRLVPTVMEPGELLVVQAHQVEDRRVDVVDVGSVLDDVEADFVRDSHGRPSLSRRRRPSTW